MTKFERVLSDPQLISLASIANPFLHADSEGDFYISETGQNVDFDDVMALLRKIEQATVKAFKEKLAEKEPIMYARTYNGEIDWDEGCVTEDDDGLLLDGLTNVNENGDFVVEKGYAVIPLYAHPMSTIEQKPVGRVGLANNGELCILANNHQVALARFCKGGDSGFVEGMKLYAHPMPSSCQGLLDSSDHIPDIGQMVAPYGYRLVRLSDINTAIQRASVFDDSGDGADPESARSCIRILKSMISSKVSDPVIPDGWQLVPKEPNRKMVDDAKRVEEDGFHAMHYAMLAAAPRYKGK